MNRRNALPFVSQISPLLMRSMPDQQRTAQNKNTTLLLFLFVLLLALLLVGLYTCRQQRTVAGKTPPYRQADAALNALQIPSLKPADQIIERTGYTLSFVPAHEQAAWVAYVLRGTQLASAHFDRTDQFLTDPLAKPHSADDADYEGSGYDRGHLASAEDMSWSEQTMRESFYYSNMTPQVPAFNRGVWKRLEELVRYWSSAYDSVYVVTGPVLTADLPAIGHDKVSVPRYYYKVVLEYNPKGVQGIGFLLRNEASSAPLKSFAVSIDSVEQLTGIDFFPKLPDDVEENAENRYNENDWLWTRRKKQ